MKFNVEIKICGINSLESAKASIGAEYIGFVFYPKSPRFLNAFDAKEISAYLNPNQKKVGLFVNADINVIKHISDFVNLDMIQLHG
ncbi:MAG: N-(5'-phosphoribosyl)anthranilate isomerase, partial [Rickettsiales bacterium]|nr:N-(5'-phosphoribosyl)anthranilate isomerase [Rickettsiales bacterium]